MHRPVGRVFIGRAHRELVAIELAQSHHARLKETFDHSGIKRASIVGQHPAARGRYPVPGNQDVFVGDRHTFEGTRFSPRNPGVGRPGLRESDLGAQVQKRIQGAGSDSIKVCARELFSAELT